MNDLRNFNETFGKDVTYYNIKRHKKAALHPLFRKYIFEKPERASIDPPSRSAFLGLRTPGKYPGKYLNQSPGSVQTFECIIPSAVCVRIRRS